MESRIKEICHHSQSRTPSDCDRKRYNQALIKAIEYNNPIQAEEAIKAGADVNTRDCSLFTPLHISITCSELRMTKLLLKNQANVNAQTDDGFTVLHLAVIMQYYDALILLLENGADHNIKDYSGKTAKDYNPDFFQDCVNHVKNQIKQFNHHHAIDSTSSQPLKMHGHAIG